ncbi:O-antigen ligase family protein [Neobacillus sp. NRS-1170]|uniref:O-antigen ligase family protein n=1 Tax=Neobacillus sp. NRS-1170 TaxID=3233898 RepID=UPI003D29139D
MAVFLILLSGLFGDYLYNKLWFFYSTILLYLLVRILVFSKKKERYLALNKKNLLIYIFIIYTCFSIFWSKDIEKSIQEIYFFFTASSLALYIVSRFRYKDFIKIIEKVFLFILFFNIFIITFFPSYGIHSDFFHKGSWKGLYVHKNGYGTMMLLSSIFFFIKVTLQQTSYKRQKSLIYLILSLISIICLYFSKSTTSLVILVILISYIVILSYWKKLKLQLFVSILCFGIALVLLIVLQTIHNSENILVGLGKDSTLTGRTEFWPIIFSYLRNDWIFGYGYGAFWSEKTGIISSISRVIGIDIYSSHNGFVDLYANLGVVGLYIFVFILLKGLILSIYKFRKEKNNKFAFISFFLLVTIFLNITETRIILANYFYWITFLTSVIYLQKKEEI